MKCFILILLMALTLAACSRNTGDDRPSSGQENAEQQQYICPMHPHYISDEDGTCPICGMDLVPVDSEGSGATTKSDSAPRGKEKILYYKHPMGLPDTSPVPKKDSMGMDYIPVYENEAAETAGTISVAPETIQTMGVQTAPITMANFGRTVRAYGAVEANTRLQSAISARVEGWVDGLAITAVGDEVRKGDLLFRLYSPDLIAAQQDFLAAARSGAEGRIASASRRLVSLGLQEQTIAALRQSGRAEERAPVYAIHDGIVSTLDVREGAFVKPGDRIAMLQGYSEIWVMTSVAEQDLGQIKAGQPVDVAFPNIPNADQQGLVDYIYPIIDPKTRTGQVRIVLVNRDNVLKPGAYADVSFTIDARARLAAPSEAILRDSRGAHVIVALGEGRFAPRPVVTGVVAKGLTEIVSGLEEDDEIVVSGQFLIDSESSLRESFRKMRAPENAAPVSMPKAMDGVDAAKDEHAGHDGGRL
ncbi:MAG: efflux RND transporter periplasmic adaptor subunit [Amphiplicatus sp.]